MRKVLKERLTFLQCLGVKYKNYLIQSNCMSTGPLVAKKIFLTKGVGIHKDKLSSFELALRDAGIEKFNLVTVSSILPPNCEVIPKAKGLTLLEPEKSLS